MIGSYIERHFIHYEIPFGSRHLGLMTAVGIGLMMAWSQWFGNATIVAAFGAHWGRLIAMFIQVMFAIVVWPIVIRKTCAEE